MHHSWKCTLLLILFVVTGHTHGQIYPKTILVGKKLVGVAKFAGILDSDWVQCVRECYYRGRCTAVNFEMKDDRPDLCHHFDVVPGTETYEDDPNYLTGTVAMWSGEFAGTCASRPCSINDKCLPAEPNHICLPWCDMPGVPTGSAGIARGWQGAEGMRGGQVDVILRRRGCAPRYMLPPEGLAATCQSDGTWSFSYPPWTCLEIQDCLDVKKCSSTFGDGAYSAMINGVITPITCSNMDTPNPVTVNAVAPGSTIHIPSCL